jgi:hypothetical protein
MSQEDTMRLVYEVVAKSDSLKDLKLRERTAHRCAITFAAVAIRRPMANF